jgi:hypothetical protein
LTSEVARIFAAGYAETARDLIGEGVPMLRVAASAVLAPFLPLLPLFTLGLYAREIRFGLRWVEAFRQAYGWPAGSLAGLDTPSLGDVEAEAA